MTQTPVNYFVGTATIDMTMTDLALFERWKLACAVFSVTTVTPNASALPIWFISTDSLPQGVAATNIAYTNLLDSVL